MPSATASETGAQARDAAVTRKVTRIALEHPQRRSWLLLFAVACLLLFLFLLSSGVLFWLGVGVWGNNIPVSWGIAISNYVWWLGIGHAGTLISALLLLVGRQWRSALNRFAETMTLFSVVCAAIYPVLHLGRPWLFYWMAPYPATTNVWPQFRSPLAWDFFAVLIYLIVSILFWFLGLLPDLAATRDRARRRSAQVVYGLLALGWRGSAAHWSRWGQAYRLTAALAVALVVAVASEYSLLFAAGPIPGWNTTIFPPYFVVGAVFSGFAVVSTITVVLRRAFRLHDLITVFHLDRLGRLLLATGLVTAYGYLAEAFDAYYAGPGHEADTMTDRATGSYAWSYWGAVLCNFLPLQLLWLRRMRRSTVALFAIGLSVTVGMWLERYMLLVTALYRDYLPSSFGDYRISFWEWMLFAGSIGLFLVPFLLVVRYLPIVSAFEVKQDLAREGGGDER